MNKLRISKTALIFFSLFVILLMVPFKLSAQEKTLNIHLFYSDTCPHCAEEEKFLAKMEQKYPNLKVNKYEIAKDRDNLNLFIEVGKRLNDKSGRVPFLVIGSDYIVGFLSEESHGVQIENKIQEAFSQGPQNQKDLVAEIIGQKNSSNQNQTKQTTGTKEKFLVNVPIVGKIDVNSLTLPAMTVVIGLLDGFNPCALWVLLFLISMLIGTQNRWKMWLLAGTFIFTSAFVYFLFMAAWLNFFLFIGYAPIVRALIGVVAVGFGGYYLWDYYKNQKSGCVAEEDEKREKTFNKIKQLAQNEHLLAAVVGIALLAVAVNIVELLCTIGLPAVYTRALTMAHMPTWKYYAYLVAYVFFFILQDLIIFFVAMFTLETVGIKQKYAKYSHLIGGVIMFLLGLVMLFKPELLTF